MMADLQPAVCTPFWRRSGDSAECTAHDLYISLYISNQLMTCIDDSFKLQRCFRLTLQWRIQKLCTKLTPYTAKYTVVTAQVDNSSYLERISALKHQIKKVERLLQPSMSSLVSGLLSSTRGNLKKYILLSVQLTLAIASQNDKSIWFWSTILVALYGCQMGHR